MLLVLKIFALQNSTFKKVEAKKKEFLKYKNVFI
jgi:hypothetical protein